MKTKNRHPVGITPRKNRGGQPGNRNAAKPMSTLSAIVRDFQKRVKAAIRLVNSQCHGRPR